MQGPFTQDMQSLSSIELVYFVVVVLLSYGMRGSTGFGAIGMPLLALIIPIKVLVPVWTLLGTASSIAILGRDRPHVAVREFVVFIPWCVFGIAMGLYFFKVLDARILARGLGAVVLIYGGYSLSSTVRAATSWRPSRRMMTPIAGTLSGIIGTVFGTMASVFFAMYLDIRGVSKQAFRATMSAMLLTLSVIRGIGYFAVGEFTQEVLLVFSAAFPLMLIGIYLGDRIHVRVNELAFRRLVGVMFVLCGVLLMLK